MKNLPQFLQSYIAWIDNGAPDTEPHYRCNGLCGNLRSFMLEGEEQVEAGEARAVYKDAHKDALQDLQQRLCRDFDTCSDPFNSDLLGYFEESMADACHLNEARTAWARKEARK